jgi:hypothetical protein
VITLLVTLLLDLTVASDQAFDRAQELAHRACEVAVYTTLAPAIPDDAIDAGAELLAVPLCREWTW